MKKTIENKEFSAIEVHKMYDDASIICDLITETTDELGEVKESVQNGIGFIKDVWQEFIAFTEKEIKELKGIRDESYTLVE